MRAVMAVVCLALVALLPGCVVQSLHPLYTEQQPAFEPALVGVWEEVNDEGASEDASVWTFEGVENKAYRLTAQFGDDRTTQQVHLVRLGDSMFLDLFPDPPQDCLEPYALSLVGVHLFMRVWLEGDELRLAHLNSDWLDEQIEQGAIVIKHESVDEDALLLTAATKDLQQLLIKHADNPEMFEDPVLLHRRASGKETAA